jgi:hypothetical protein
MHVASALPEVLAAPFDQEIGKRRACHGDFHTSPVNALAGGRKSIRFCTLIVSLRTSLTPSLSINTLYNTAPPVYYFIPLCALLPFTNLHCAKTLFIAAVRPINPITLHHHGRQQ